MKTNEPLASTAPRTAPKLLDQVRDAIRTRHYSRRTEATYADWIRRFIVFHHRKHPSTMGAPEITAFLSWLATGQRVSSSTENQALSAVLFLYRHVLRIEVGAIEQVPRAKMPHRVPVVRHIESSFNESDFGRWPAWHRGHRRGMQPTMWQQGAGAHGVLIF